MLHIFRDSPSSSAFNRCLKQIAEGDALLLIESAVYATLQSSSNQALVDLAEKGQVYVLREDLAARALSCEVGKELDYQGMVELTAQYSPSLTW